MLLYYYRAIYRPGGYEWVEPAPQKRKKPKRIFEIQGRKGSQTATEIAVKTLARGLAQDAKSREIEREDEEMLLLKLMLDDDL